MARDVLFSKTIQTSSGAHTVYYQTGITVLSHLNLVPRSRMSGVKPLLSLYAFMA
jgi:hypothetical protein